MSYMIIGAKAVQVIPITTLKRLAELSDILIVNISEASSNENKTIEEIFKIKNIHKYELEERDNQLSTELKYQPKQFQQKFLKNPISNYKSPWIKKNNYRR